MKKFLNIIVLSLCLITPSQADDIGDFEIDGMSIGDSVLDYMNKDEVKSKMRYGFESKEYAYVEIKKKSERYDEILLLFQPNDRRKIIHSISARILYETEQGINTCYNEQKQITKEMSEMFRSVKLNDVQTYNYSPDKTGKSKVTTVNFDFDDGSVAHIGCYKFSKELRKEYQNPTPAMLSVGLGSKDYNEFQRERAYK